MTELELTLSRMFDILYSKFWPATRGLNKYFPYGPVSAKISPQAPPTLGCFSKHLYSS
jgi:hypothetical protein